MARKLAKAQYGKIVKGAAKYVIPEQGIKKAIKKAGDYDIDKYIKEVPKSSYIRTDIDYSKLIKTNKKAVAKDVAKKVGTAGAGAAAGYAAGSKKKMGGSIKSKKKK